ncbi:transposase (plasmid) [Komagataeibacter medellinensis NBRC 3288]|uniref:Transposase n=1 Tax=Komagataeibacter medellinensis (strain NBRC 3288 / BCRC 11682 / LMG 1693 / Kondo 51) TaxID=634177 RepID=G2I7Y9_KOMMN|nr:transposase [Komagataeibacter medellinensis NBRC 3288]
MAEDDPANGSETAIPVTDPGPQRHAGRRPLPSDLPRERVVIPAPAQCPCCGSARLTKLGESITETLEVIPRRFRVIQTVREKFSCRDCETITQPPAPFHPLVRGRAGPHLLASVLVGKFAVHQPLNRQAAAFAREGIALDTSTLAAWFGYSRDRRGEHPATHLDGWSGIVQADAYAGYNALAKPGRQPAPATLAGCWAHARRGLFRLAELGRAPLAVEAVHRIDCLFKVERTINGVVPQQRAALRQQFSAPIVENLMEWMHDSCSRMSGKSPTPDSATRFPKVMLS